MLFGEVIAHYWTIGLWVLYASNITWRCLEGDSTLWIKGLYILVTSNITWLLLVQKFNHVAMLFVEWWLLTDWISYFSIPYRSEEGKIGNRADNSFESLSNNPTHSRMSSRISPDLAPSFECIALLVFPEFFSHMNTMLRIVELSRMKLFHSRRPFTAHCTSAPVSHFSWVYLSHRNSCYTNVGE